MPCSSSLYSAAPMLCESALLWWSPIRGSTVATAKNLDAYATNGYCCFQACGILHKSAKRANCDMNCRQAPAATQNCTFWSSWQLKMGPKNGIGPDPDYDLGEIKPELFQNSGCPHEFLLAGAKINTAKALFRQSVHCRYDTYNAMAQGCTSHTSFIKLGCPILTRTLPWKTSKEISILFHLTVTWLHHKSCFTTPLSQKKQ